MSTSHPGDPRVLVVDDEVAARSGLAELLRDEGFAVRTAGDGFKALGVVEEWTPDVVVTDVQMPGMSGIELLSKLRERVPGVGLVVMTAYASVDNAVTAMHEGADDYLAKPLHFPELLIVVRRVLERCELHRENDRLREALHDGIADHVGWVGHSKSSRSLMELVGQVAHSDASVLLLGESGTGKALVARALHKAGSRSEGPFVSVSCAAMQDERLERDFFGGEGAPGRLGGARGGTLFLEDVAALSSTAQAHLLQLLRQPRVPGGEFDVRVIVATDHDLHSDLAAGNFREDLFYQLNVITLRVPTLRERRDDVALLAMYFLRRYAAKSRKDIRGLSDRALGVLLGSDWPGNVRQLEGAIQHAVVLCQGREITPKDLPRDLLGPSEGRSEAPPIPGASMEEIERYAIITTLEHVGGSTRRAAEMLGISTRKIQYRLAEYRDRGPSGTPAVAAASRTDGSATSATSMPAEASK